MKLITLPSKIAYAELRALKTVAIENNKLEYIEIEMLEAIQNYILKTDFNIYELEAIAPKELAEIVTEYKHRQDLIHNCILISLIDGKITQKKTTIVNNFAKALGIDDQAVKTLKYLTKGYFLLVRINIFRYAFIGPKVVDIIINQRLKGVITVIKYIINLKDRKTAARYQKLLSYPEGSLGREFYNFIRKNNFGLPGERGKKTEILIAHDCTHILANYGVSISEEIQVLAFQSGYLNRNPFWGLLFTILQLHLGIKILEPSSTYINRVQPESFIKAFYRGTQVNIDLMKNWNPWTVFHRQVKDLQEEYNILPR